MKRIPQTFIEEVRNQTNIVDVIGQYVQLRKSGKNYLGLCPFHGENTPSFSVAEDKQIFHCFGCGKGGNVFTFLQEIEGLSFPEAVLKVAENTELSSDWNVADFKEQQTNAQSSTQQQLIQLHEKAKNLYQHILLHTEVGEPALKYLLERGMTKEQIETFEIGFAPKERIVLHQVMQNDQVEERLLRASGLFVQRENGEWLDRFYDRIMFPIRNPQGKTIAFSGRIFSTGEPIKDQPKYLNSPETELFNKRFTLFNLDLARTHIRKQNEIILFEGFMDVLAAWRAGVKNGIATMGTSLTSEQIQMIQRLTSQVLICYDGDNAGLNAAERAVQLLQEQSTASIQVIRLPEKLDPDEYIKKYGTEAFKELVSQGRETPFTFKMHFLEQGKNLENETERINFLQELLPELAQVSSVLEREVYIQELVKRFHVKEEVLYQEISQIQQAAKKEKAQKKKAIPRAEESVVQPLFKQKRHFNRTEKAERLLLYRTMHERSALEYLRQVPDFSFVHDEYQELYLHLVDFISFHGQFVLADFLDYLKDDRLKGIVTELDYMEVSEESSEKELIDCLKMLDLARLEAEQAKKQAELEEAKRVGNSELMARLAQEIIHLQIRIKQQ